MVGVPKSTGCFICRKRKIKCDESWPTCVNCQKNGKSCPGPPLRHTFRVSRTNCNADTIPAVVGNYLLNPDKHQKLLTQLNEKRSEGGVQMKFRISNQGSAPERRPPRTRSHTPPGAINTPPSSSHDSTPEKTPPQRGFLRQPSPSQHHELAQALINALNTGSFGHRMSTFGTFIQKIPARIGHNAALDAAAACLVNAHSSLVHSKNAHEILNPRLYLRAVVTLQYCLDTEIQDMSSNSLCASVLLGLVEALAGPRVGNRYLAHVGGASRLMELQGPDKCQTPFAKEILRFNRGGIVITSIYERRPCFLTTPEWRDVAFDKTGLDFDDCLYTDVLQYMAEFPEILREMKDLEHSSMSDYPDIDLGDMININYDDNDGIFGFSEGQSFLANDFSDDPYYVPHTQAAKQNALLEKLYGFKSKLYDLGQHLDARLINGTAAIEEPSIDPTNPIRMSYHFTKWRVIVAYNCFWSTLILTNKLILKLISPLDAYKSTLKEECRSTAYEICKTWEVAWASKPIGAFHTGLSFVVAYEFCSKEVQGWILSSLNALLDEQLIEAHMFRWTHDIISLMSAKLAGEGPDLRFTQGKKE